MKQLTFSFFVLCMLSLSGCTKNIDKNMSAEEVARIAQKTNRFSPGASVTLDDISKRVANMDLQEIGVLFRKISFDEKMYYKDKASDIRLHVIDLAARRAAFILIDECRNRRLSENTRELAEAAFAPHPFLLHIVAYYVARASFVAYDKGRILESDNLRNLLKQCAAMYEKIRVWKLARNNAFVNCEGIFIFVPRALRRFFRVSRCGVIRQAAIYRQPPPLQENLEWGGLCQHELRCIQG